MIAIDDYVVDVLMRDLVAHDRAPSAFLVYLHLWSESEGRQKSAVIASHQMIAEVTGLSKSAVQKGIRCLARRKLIKVHKNSPTAIPRSRPGCGFRRRSWEPRSSCGRCSSRGPLPWQHGSWTSVTSSSGVGGTGGSPPSSGPAPAIRRSTGRYEAGRPGGRSGTTGRVDTPRGGPPPATAAH